MSDFRLRLIQEISKPTDRDKQKRVGPSELGKDCNKCLARGLMDERADQDFSLYPWLGTGNHLYMEHATFPEAEHELKLLVGEVEGYGEIKGTTDMYDPADKAVVDWKFVGLKNLKKYRVQGVSQQYRVQGQLYGRGCELSGRRVEKIRIAFIPRDSGNPKDIWVHEELYNPEIAENALERASALWAWLQEPGNHWRDLDEAVDCFQCNYVF